MASGGVSEYWIVDPKERAVIQYYFAEKELLERKTYEYPGFVQSLHFKGLELSLEDIFKE